MKKPFKDELGRSRDKKKSLIRNGQATFDLMGCGERGIRTPGTSRYDGFQDRCNRPLYHLSLFETLQR